MQTYHPHPGMMNVSADVAGTFTRLPTVALKGHDPKVSMDSKVRTVLGSPVIFNEAGTIMQKIIATRLHMASDSNQCNLTRQMMRSRRMLPVIHLPIWTTLCDSDLIPGKISRLLKSSLWMWGHHAQSQKQEYQRLVSDLGTWRWIYYLVLLGSCSSS